MIIAFLLQQVSSNNYKYCSLIPVLIFISKLKQILKAGDTFEKCQVAIILLQSILQCEASDNWPHLECYMNIILDGWNVLGNVKICSVGMC